MSCINITKTSMIHGCIFSGIVAVAPDAGNGKSRGADVRQTLVRRFAFRRRVIDQPSRRLLDAHERQRECRSRDASTLAANNVYVRLPMAEWLWAPGDLLN